MLARISTAEKISAILRRAMKSMRVLLRMMSMLFVSLTRVLHDPELKRERLDALASAVDQVHHGPGAEDGGEHRGHDAQRQRYRKTLDRPGAEHEQHQGCDQRGDVGICNGRESLAVTCPDRGLRRIAQPQFL